MRSYHDLGGTPAGPVPREDHDLAQWEKRVEALLVLLWREKILRLDENRRGLESLGAEIYHSSSYAERRIAAVAHNLVIKGIFTIDELTAKLADIERRPAQLP
ncbi:MAG: hypothetical protein ACREUW_09500 [Burkholderiales bacterium]